MSRSTQEQRRRRISFASTLGAAVLLFTAVAVFAWGTGYKLSLYKDASQQGRAPQAKLCTRASEAAKNQVEASVTGAPHHEAVPVLLALAALPAQIGAPPATALAADSARFQPVLASSSGPVVFVRPPPAV